MNLLQQKIVTLLQEKEEINTSTINIPSQEIHGALLSLQSADKISFIQQESSSFILTEEGASVLEKGSREYNFYLSINDNDDISVCQNDKIGSSFAFKYKWIEKRGNKIKKKENVIDLTKKNLQEKENVTELQKRNLIKQVKEISYLVRRGNSFFRKESVVDKVTSNYILEKKDLPLKQFNFDSKGVAVPFGSLHPLLKFKSEIKKIFLEMGFTEMDTSKFVVSAFWNFDSLYQPQDHPSREAHDTFYLSDMIVVCDFEITEEEREEIRKNIKEGIFSYKENEVLVYKHFERERMKQEKGKIKVIFKEEEKVDEKYLERVKQAHEEGLPGSTGYRNKWSKEESEKIVLRTHTTSYSAKHLYTMPSESRFFSIDRVFRNESVDSTHLPEFHQVEGFLIGDNLGLGDLIQTISLFFSKLGITDIKFKPAYNPYTEPSSEVYGYHPLLKKWIEIGNSGVFRPEMIETMGYKGKTVLGFGLSVERPAMIKYGCDNIRDLMGSRVDLKFVSEEGVCMVDN